METLRRWRTLGLIALGYIAGGAGYVWLPGGPAALSDPDFVSRPFIRMLLALLLPTTAAAIYASVRVVWRRDPVRDPDEAFESAYEPIVFVVAAFILVLHVMVLGVLTGTIPQSREALSRAVIVLVGLLLAAVANLLPRTRPNLAIGFRTRWTLENRRLWMEIHRTAGYFGVILGLVMATAGALLPKAAMQAVIGWGMLAGVVMFALFVCKHAAASQAPR
jgi:hypothetical protein